METLTTDVMDITENGLRLRKLRNKSNNMQDQDDKCPRCDRYPHEPRPSFLPSCSDCVTAPQPTEEKISSYCIKCKDKRDIKNQKNIELPSKNGGTRPAIRGNCPVCGTGMFKLLPVGDDERQDTFQPTEREMEEKLKKVLTSNGIDHTNCSGTVCDPYCERETAAKDVVSLVMPIVDEALAAQRREHEADLARRREAIEKIPTVAVVGNCIVRTEVLNAFDSFDRKGE